MSKYTGSLQPKLGRAQKALDRLEPGAIIIDGRGHAWQKDRGDYWYRAFDAEHVASWELAQVTLGQFETLRVPS